MAKPSELSELVERARKKDEDAFGELVRRFSPAVRSICLLRAADPQRADDISQQVFLTAWKRLPDLAPQSVFWPWLESITRNHLLNEWRRTQRERGFKQRYTVAWLALQETADEQQEAAEDQAAQVVALRYCLENLPSNLRTLVKMRYEDCHSSEKIAVQMGRSADSVRQGFVRLREKLRECIEQRVLLGGNL